MDIDITLYQLICKFIVAARHIVYTQNKSSVEVPGNEMSLVVENRSSGFLTWSETNRKPGCAVTEDGWNT